MSAPRPDERFRVLTAELLHSLATDEIGHAVVHHVAHRIGEDVSRRAEIVRRLPAGVQAIYATWLVDAEVNNGGFNQFFYNPSGELAGDALVGYELLGAEDYAAVMRAAIATRESERERMARFYDADTLEAFSESYRHTELNEVDQRYYALGDRIYDIWASFARERPRLITG